MTTKPFSGSYEAEDVTFLLKIIDLPPTQLAQREYKIQTGQAHYSEMIGSESAPSPPYLEAFHEAVNNNGAVMAKHLAALAAVMAHSRPGPLTVVSLARAGVPIGVLLTRILRIYFKREVKHYSISIIRDRGVDPNALNHILNVDCCPDTSLIFVDGWTGKGVMARELNQAVDKYNLEHGVNISPALHVLTDLCGWAGAAPSYQDFLIPSCLLNSTVSGLISRTILNKTHIKEHDFHGCLYYDQLASVDLSGWFIDQIMAQVEILNGRSAVKETAVKTLSPSRCQQLQQASEEQIQTLGRDYNFCDINLIKIGLGESTRVLLRRVPEILLLKDPGATAVTHLKIMAEAKGVKVIYRPDLSFEAVALIKSVDSRKL